MHIDPVWDPVPPDGHLNMGFLFPEPDDLFILAPFMGLGGAAYINGFQDIGLSLGIVAVKHIGPAVEVHM